VRSTCEAGTLCQFLLYNIVVFRITSGMMVISGVVSVWILVRSTREDGFSVQYYVPLYFVRIFLYRTALCVLCWFIRIRCGVLRGTR
jgi:hypothetical protein